jgi:hypothetical protein
LAGLLGRQVSRHRFNHIVNLNTRIVVVCSTVLLVAGTLTFALAE